MEPKAPNINMEKEVLMELAGPSMGAAYLSQQLRNVFLLGNVTKLVLSVWGRGQL